MDVLFSVTHIFMHIRIATQNVVVLLQAFVFSFDLVNIPDPAVAEVQPASFSQNQFVVLHSQLPFPNEHRRVNIWYSNNAGEALVPIPPHFE